MKEPVIADADTRCLMPECPMTLLYYVGGGGYLCWAHLLGVTKGNPVALAEIMDGPRTNASI